MSDEEARLLHRHARRRRVWKWIGIGSLVIVVLVATTLVAAYKKLESNIHGISTSVLGNDRPTKPKVQGPQQPLNVLIMGVEPQVLPRFIGFATYQLDSNLRNSTMVGIVGGGGIGATLFTAYQRFDYDVVLAILIVIVALIMVAEIVSGWARKVFQ